MKWRAQLGRTPVRWALGVAALAVLIGIAWLAFGRPAVKVSVSAASQTEQGDSTELHGAHVVAREAGKPLWSLVAQSLNQSGDEVKIVGISDGTLYRAGEAYAHITAPRADWNRKSGEVDFRGGVEVHYQGGVVIQTAELAWRRSDQQLTAPQAVRLTQAELTIDADGMVADTAAQTVRFSGHVRITRKTGLQLDTSELLYHTDTKRADLIGSLSGSLPAGK